METRLPAAWCFRARFLSVSSPMFDTLRILVMCVGGSGREYGSDCSSAMVSSSGSIIAVAEMIGWYD